QYECYRLFSNLQGLSKSKKKGNKVGRLRFKGYRWWKTVAYNQSGYKLINTNKHYDKLKLSKIGEINIRVHREIEGNIKGIIIKRKVNNWEAHIITDAKYIISKGSNEIGIDVGVLSFLHTSNNEIIKNPLHMNKELDKLKNIHRQIEPGVFVYMKSYNTSRMTGHKFAIEKFDDKELKSKLISNYIKWDTTKNIWTIKNYYIRNYLSYGKEEIIKGESIDTVLNMLPEDFSRNEHFVETMNTPQLNKFIDEQKMQGAANITTLLIEKYRRIAYPFSTFILTLIGVSLSSRKVRGGMGMHIGVGLLLSFSYILFMRFAVMFAISGSLRPLFAVWLPNIIYSLIALFIYKLAPK
ncbi:MAG: LptF/LptG family permease, partial [Bacteroidota bacterium]|nr:LptF/LptG family permease [Bacteroidota bacterium]